MITGRSVDRPFPDPPINPSAELEPITYIGEHTFAGQLGHALTLISFASALLAGLGYLLFTNTGDTGWRTVGRLGFRLHSLAVIGIVVTLFVMLFKHWFEYDYVWKHSNTEMPLRYIASCFWEGQEGSFLLWTFWGVVLGNILIWREGRKPDGGWEGPVLAVFALVQVFLASMLLGVYIFDIRIGSSPFLLIRELPENLGLPWTKLAGYLERIPQFEDGRGLNPLLQNYWMVIHPPTLFLGFASTLVPFSFAIAGLWRKKLKDWMAPALPWTFFGIMVLGTGILMGGAWAYEALSFGGFWAWDPVENGSFDPVDHPGFHRAPHAHQQAQGDLDVHHPAARVGYLPAGTVQQLPHAQRCVGRHQCAQFHR